MTTITPQQIIDAMAIAERCVRLARDLLDPEDYGHAATPEIRNAARRALGLPAVESSHLPMPSFNESDARRAALTWPRGSLGEDTTEGTDHG